MYPDSIALMDLERELAGYVLTNCQNNRELILSTSFDVGRSAEPQPEPPAPGDVRALVSAYPGRLEVRWAGVAGRKLYSLYMTDTDPLDPAGWKLLI